MHPGNESIAVVEFAPYQKIPTEKKKVDSRIATIEKGEHNWFLWSGSTNPVVTSDEDFISFIESLKEPASKPSDTDLLETLCTLTYLSTKTSTN